MINVIYTSRITKKIGPSLEITGIVRRTMSPVIQVLEHLLTGNGPKRNSRFGLHTLKERAKFTYFIFIPCPNSFCRWFNDEHQMFDKMLQY